MLRHEIEDITAAIGDSEEEEEEEEDVQKLQKGKIETAPSAVELKKASAASMLFPTFPELHLESTQANMYNAEEDGEDEESTIAVRLAKQDSFCMRALNAVISDFEDPDDLTGFGSEELDTGDETRKRRVSSFEDDDDDDGLAEESLLLSVKSDLLSIRIEDIEAEVIGDDRSSGSGSD